MTNRPTHPTNSRHVWLAVLALAWLAVLEGCLLTQDLDALKSGDCGGGKKACERDGELACVPDDDPALGCAEPFCDCGLSHATARCGTGNLEGRCVVATCEPGWLFCGGDTTEGCQIDGRTSVQHCGQCNNPCSSLPNTSEPACANGSCAVGACLRGYGHCDENVTNGCETNLNTSNDHCGRCDQPCSGTCVDGKCTVD